MPVVVPVAAPDDVAVRHRLARRAVGLVEALGHTPRASPVAADGVDDERADPDVRDGRRELHVVAAALDLHGRDVREGGHREIGEERRDRRRQELGQRRCAQKAPREHTGERQDGDSDEQEQQQSPGHRAEATHVPGGRFCPLGGYGLPERGSVIPLPRHTIRARVPGRGPCGNSGPSGVANHTHGGGGWSLMRDRWRRGALGLGLVGVIATLTLVLVGAATGYDGNATSVQDGRLGKPDAARTGRPDAGSIKIDEQRARLGLQRRPDQHPLPGWRSGLVRLGARGSTRSRSWR